MPPKVAFDEEEEDAYLVKKVEIIKHAPATIVPMPLSSANPTTTNIIAKEVAHSDSNQITKRKNQEVVATKPKVQEIADSRESRAVEDVSKKEH